MIVSVFIISIILLIGKIIGTYLYMKMQCDIFKDKFYGGLKENFEIE